MTMKKKIAGYSPLQKSMQLLKNPRVLYMPMEWMNEWT